MIGLGICAAGLALLFSPPMLFQRIVDGFAWLFIGNALCFVPEFNLRFNRDSFTLALGLLMISVGLFFKIIALRVFFEDHRAHGLLPFYELIGIGPLLFTTGILIGFNKRKLFESANSRHFKFFLLPQK